jgi:septum formation protein
MTRLTLASQSPRRAKILADLGVAFDVVKTDAPEISLPHDPEGTVLANARAKLLACGRAPALAADTIVWFAGKIYGKPRDLAEAKEFLRELSGQTHVVFTGVAYLASPPSSPILTACARSDVTFRVLSEAAIGEYVARVHPLDRAGAYDIDESGDLIVASYTGEYENIMGLPVEPLHRFDII